MVKTLIGCVIYHYTIGYLQMQICKLYIQMLLFEISNFQNKIQNLIIKIWNLQFYFVILQREKIIANT